MKLKIIALILAILFSVGIITSCSGNNDSEKSSTNTSVTESEAAKYYDDDDDLDDDDIDDDDDTDDDDDDDDSDDEDDFDWEDALDEVCSYIDIDDDEIENKINYKILPAKNGESFFIRYSLEDKDSDDALIFKNGKNYFLSVDGKSKFTEYKNNFTVDITNVTDEELLKQKDCINGGFGAEFD